MAKRIYVSGNSLIVEDTISGNLDFDVPKKDYYYSWRELRNRDNISMYDANVKNWQQAQRYDVLLSNAVDQAGTPYTVNSFTDFARNNLRQ